jgi:hypothetical protein
MDKILTILTSVYKPNFFEDFVNDTISQTIFEDCKWEIFEVGVDEPSYKKTLPDNVRYRSAKKRTSVYEEWNRLAKESKTPYLANYNCDDRSNKIHLETLVNYLEIDYDSSMAYCPNLETNKENETFESNSAGNSGFPCYAFDAEKYWLNNSAHARPVWRKTLHDKYGYFNTDYKICADYDFWLKCIQGGEKFAKAVQNPLYLYYRNPEGVSSKKDSLQDALKEIDKIRKSYTLIR